MDSYLTLPFTDPSTYPSHHHLVAPGRAVRARSPANLSDTTKTTVSGDALNHINNPDGPNCWFSYESL